MYGVQDIGQEIGVYLFKVNKINNMGIKATGGTLKGTMALNHQNSHPLLGWFLERFPNMFPMLRNLLELLN